MLYGLVFKSAFIKKYGMGAVIDSHILRAANRKELNNKKGMASRKT
jgi:hypothetical protein